MKPLFLALLSLVLLAAPSGEPPVSPTIGFFLDNWQPKTFTAPPAVDAPSAPAARAGAGSPAATTITVDAANVITRIPPSEFGHNANYWMTAMVTEPAFLNHVGNLHPHIIRFPAGSGSDCYFWNRWYGSLPPDVPAELVDNKGKKKAPGYMYGRFFNKQLASVDNYYTMLKMTGNEGLLTVNYGYARYGTSADPVAAAAHLADARRPGCPHVRLPRLHPPAMKIGLFGARADGQGRQDHHQQARHRAQSNLTGAPTRSTWPTSLSPMWRARDSALRRNYRGERWAWRTR